MRRVQPVSSSTPAIQGRVARFELNYTRFMSLARTVSKPIANRLLLWIQAAERVNGNDDGGVFMRFKGEDGYVEERERMLRELALEKGPVPIYVGYDNRINSNVYVIVYRWGSDIRLDVALLPPVDTPYVDPGLTRNA